MDADKTLALFLTVVFLSILVGWAMRASLSNQEYLNGYRAGFRAGSRHNPNTPDS